MTTFDQVIHILYHIFTIILLMLMVYKTFNISHILKLLLEGILANTYLLHKHLDNLEDMTAKRLNQCSGCKNLTNLYEKDTE